MGFWGHDKVQTGLKEFSLRMDLQKLHGFQMLLFSEHLLTKDKFLKNLRVLISNIRVVF